MDAVRTEGLSKTYPDGTVAVAGIDLTVNAGEVFALLGPNGAGKSTTVGMLTTGVIPTAGRAWVAGTDIAARPAAARRHIGVVPQRVTLDTSLSVRDNLVFHGRYHGMGRSEAARRADLGLARVSLGHVAAKAVTELSGGMVQRLMIARAVLHDPAVLFLDEPTTGLDPQSRHGLHEIVRQLRTAGQTIVLITHDMQEADRLADRVAIIDHGRLLALDTPEALKRSIDADTAVTVTADHDSEALAALLRESLPKAHDVRTVDGTVRLSVSGDTAVLPAIARTTADAGVALRDVRIDTPTLETVFFHLTGTDLREP